MGRCATLGGGNNRGKEAGRACHTPVTPRHRLYDTVLFPTVGLRRVLPGRVRRGLAATSLAGVVEGVPAARQHRVLRLVGLAGGRRAGRVGRWSPQVGAHGVHRSAGAGVAPAAWVIGVVVVDVVTFVAVARVRASTASTSASSCRSALGLLVLRCISYVVDVHRGAVEPAPIVDAALALSLLPDGRRRPAGAAGRGAARSSPPRPTPAASRRRGRSACCSSACSRCGWWPPYLRHRSSSTRCSPPRTRHSALEALVAIYGFTVQLFAELAGYASMAVGAALLLGLHLPDNFDAPFTATSLRSFWRRWTSTFSAWFRDYVYVPLGGDRDGGTGRPATSSSRWSSSPGSGSSAAGPAWPGACSWASPWWSSVRCAATHRRPRWGRRRRRLADHLQRRRARLARRAGRQPRRGRRPPRPARRRGATPRSSRRCAWWSIVGMVAVQLLPRGRAPRRRPAPSPVSRRSCRASALAVGLLVIDALGPGRCRSPRPSGEVLMATQELDRPTAGDDPPPPPPPEPPNGPARWPPARCHRRRRRRARARRPPELGDPARHGREPPGRLARRGRWPLDVAEPLHDVASAVGLTKPRECARRLARARSTTRRAWSPWSDRHHHAAAGATTTHAGRDRRRPRSPTIRAPRHDVRRPGHRPSRRRAAPRPAGPLPAGTTKVLIAGDSMAQGLGQMLAPLAAGRAGYSTEAIGKASTGLTRPDFFDWPARLMQADRRTTTPASSC